jgi:hypothetical protein
VTVPSRTKCPRIKLTCRPLSGFPREPEDRLLSRAAGTDLGERALQPQGRIQACGQHGRHGLKGTVPPGGPDWERDASAAGLVAADPDVGGFEAREGVSSADVKALQQAGREVGESFPSC